MTRDTYIVMFSSGIGSWAAARRLIDDLGTSEGVTLLFADTNVEDADNYRFLIDAATDLLGPLTMTSLGSDRKVWRGEGGGRLWWMTNHGKTIWDVFEEQSFLGNTRVDLCSRVLKREPMREWLDDRCDPTSTVVVLGFGFEEAHRLERARPYWEPWTIDAPMSREPYMVKDQVLAWSEERGLEPPRLYEDVGGTLPHANCGGLCVKAGQAQFKGALFDDRLRDVYLEWEAREEKMRDQLGDVAILRDRSRTSIMERLDLTDDDLEDRLVSRCEDPDCTPDGACDHEEWRTFIKGADEELPKMLPLPLKLFRQRLEGNVTLFDPLDVGTCSCMTPGQDEEDAA